VEVKARPAVTILVHADLDAAQRAALDRAMHELARAGADLTVVGQVEKPVFTFKTVLPRASA
jgi:nucleotide-binding universal stress UspA family protein